MAEKILIVDDDPDLLTLTQEIMKAEGYEVEAVTTGEEAITKVKQNSYNAILLDMMLPRVDGFEVCWRIKNNSQTKNIPIIAMTALDIPGIGKRCFDSGADELLLKPFDVKKLVETVKKVLGKPNSA